MIYNLQEIYEIRKNMISYVLQSEIMMKIQTIEKEIGVKIFPERSIYPSNLNASSSPPYESIRRLPSSSIRTNRSSSNYNNHHNNNNNNSFSKSSSSRVLSKIPDDLSWENVRNFKTTKLEKKEGIDKKINDIRICLNKISAKNYDTQKETIFQYISSIRTSEDSEEEILVSQEALEKIANAIFDIASTNKFFSEIYAKLYKSLVELYPIFNQVLNRFVTNFMDSLQEIKYVDPNVDYDAFCAYNKQNDKRKASAVFLIHMMKLDILAVSKVIEILSNFVVKIEENMEMTNRLNEVEEMTEVLFLFLQEGFAFLLHTKDVIKEKEDLTFISNKVRSFATYKIKEKASLSSRVIFKYMDLVTIMNKETKQ